MEARWLAAAPARAVHAIDRSRVRNEGGRRDRRRLRGVDTQPTGRAIHIILDNLATHKTQKVRTFLAAHPQVHLHFTPTYSSWLNQVELWFAKIDREVLARGIFTSVTDLRRKILRYIRRYNKDAKPFRWAYADPTRRIA